MSKIKRVEEIKNIKLTVKQAISFAIVTLEHFKNSANKEITSSLFGEYMITLIQMYSLNEIEMRAKSILEREKSE